MPEIKWNFSFMPNALINGIVVLQEMWVQISWSFLIINKAILKSFVSKM